MFVVLFGTVVWAALGGRGPGEVAVADPAGLEAEGSVATEREVPRAPATADAASVAGSLPASDVSAASERQVPLGDVTAASDPQPVPTALRDVVRPVAAQSSVPRPRRPLAPSDTTAAGHAGLAEALLAAGDTSGAIVAYNAFLARNTDPVQERAALAKLREIGVTWRSSR
jgi:hypothetical protein